MDTNNLNIDFHIDASPRFKPTNQIIRDFRIVALHASTEGDLELTEHGKALFQEYLTSSILRIELGVPEHTYCKWSLPEIQPRRKRAYCNSRIKMVQAKRKALDMDIDGKYSGLRRRRDSWQYRQATEEWIVGKRASIPHKADYEHVPARVQRKQQRNAKRVARNMARLYKPLVLSEKDRVLVEEASREGAIAMDMPAWYVKDALMRVLEWGKQ